MFNCFFFKLSNGFINFDDIIKDFFLGWYFNFIFNFVIKFVIFCSVFIICFGQCVEFVFCILKFIWVFYLLFIELGMMDEEFGFVVEGFVFFGIFVLLFGFVLMILNQFDDYENELGCGMLLLVIMLMLLVLIWFLMWVVVV